ncbi:MAG TPA: tetratricopeptide repeat protein [Thermoguttaceae bacterium]|nr:tetratricopeptide repeat protein [Thermoguttaceae bacterium]
MRISCLDFMRLTALLLLLLLWTPIAWAQDAAETVEPIAVEVTAENAESSEEAPADAPQPEDLFTQGRNALFQGQYTQAIELLSKAVEADETKTGYRLHLARAYRYADKNDEAATHLEEILKKAPDHVEAGQMLGEIYAATQRWRDVVRVLQPLLKYRHDYTTYHMLAEAQYNLDDHENARKNYEESVKLNPQSAADHYQLGNIYLSGNFFALAAESYQSALRLGLDSPVLRYKLGSAYFNLRNYFGRIAVQTVKSGEVGTIYGAWYLIEPVPGSKETFRCAPETSAVYQIARAVADGLEERSDIRVLRATIYLNARRYAQALDMFAKIGDAVPEEDRSLVHYYHAQAAFGTGQYDRYLELLQEAIKLDPEAYQATLVDAYMKVADQYNQAGKLDKYIEYLALAVTETPQTASLHLKLGNAYEEDQKHDLAMAQWQMVLDLEPDHPDRMKLLNLIQRYRSNLAVSVVASPTEKQPAEEDSQPKP